jgi:hypothetical protein
MQAAYDVRGTLHATGDYFLPNGAKPEESDGTQIFEEGIERRQAHDEEAQGWHVEERPLRPQGEEPQTGDRDRIVGGEGQGQEGAEEGIEETQIFKEKGGKEVEAEGEEVARSLPSSPAANTKRCTRRQSDEAIQNPDGALDCFAS